MASVEIIAYMFPVIAILENGFDSFVCGCVIIYQIRKDSHYPSFQVDRNLESCKLYSMMNENFHLWKIMTNSLFTCIYESSEGLRDRVHILVH